jgi:hypothetical protein
MGDFPPPRPKEPYRTPEADPSTLPAPPRVVQRAEPPPPDEEPRPGARRPALNLTKDEVSALLAVSEAAHPKPWAQTGRRATILVPVSLVGLLFRLVLGEYDTIAQVVLFVAALAWIARPLYAKRSQGWA